jgi:hypothetical protein
MLGERAQSADPAPDAREARGRWEEARLRVTVVGREGMWRGGSRPTRKIFERRKTDEHCGSRWISSHARKASGRIPWGSRPSSWWRFGAGAEAP